MSWVDCFVREVKSNEIDEMLRKKRDREIQELLNNLTVDEENMLQQSIRKLQDGQSKYSNVSVSIKLREEELFLYILWGQNRVYVTYYEQFEFDYGCYKDALDAGEKLDTENEIEEYSRDETLQTIRWYRQLLVKDLIHAPFYDEKVALKCLVKLKKAEEGL